MRSANHTLILVIAILLTVGILGWRMMQPPAPLALEEEADVAQFSTRLIQATTRISRINLDAVAKAIQSDPSYQALVDFSRPLPEIEVGRENPFLPFEKIDYNTQDISSEGGGFLSDDQFSF